MQMRRTCSGVLLTAILASLSATPLFAQNVPTPPKPSPDGPSLEETLDSLKRVLASSGELNYKNDSTQMYSRVGDVRVEPADCRIRVTVVERVGDLSTEEHSDWFFLESIDAAEALTLQEALSRSHGEAKLSPGYVVAINGHPGRLKFGEQAVATKVAQLLLAGARICQARHLSFNAAAGNPSLKDTLQFIEQKLKGEAEAQWMTQWGTGSAPGSFRVVDASSDPVTCQLRYRDTGGDPGQLGVLTFRRVQEIEELPLQTVVQQQFDKLQQDLDFLDNLHSETPQHTPTSIVTVTPDVIVLRVKYQGGQVAGEIYFSDREIADRVAKAMNHAAELCRPENKEPF
jgi:hypothetical protein